MMRWCYRCSFRIFGIKLLMTEIRYCWGPETSSLRLQLFKSPISRCHQHHFHQVRSRAIYGLTYCRFWGSKFEQFCRNWLLDFYYIECLGNSSLIIRSQNEWDFNISSACFWVMNWDFWFRSRTSEYRRKIRLEMRIYAAYS